MGLAAEVLDKGAELLCKCEEDLVLVVEALEEEGDELLSAPLGPEGEGDGREAAYRVEPEDDVLALELVDEDGERVE